jgi:hypothetical protein
MNSSAKYSVWYYKEQLLLWMNWQELRVLMITGSYQDPNDENFDTIKLLLALKETI